MKTLYLNVIRLLSCIIIGWLLSTLIEEEFNPIHWGICGITFMIVFVVSAHKCDPKQLLFKWLGGAIFVSLFVFVVAYFVIFCFVQNMNPLEWNKWLRVLYSVVIGFGFILGGRFWNYWLSYLGLASFLF